MSDQEFSQSWYAFLAKVQASPTYSMLDFDPDDIYPFPSAMSTNFGLTLPYIAAIAWEEIALSPHWNNKGGYTYSYSCLLPNGDFISLSRADMMLYSRFVGTAIGFDETYTTVPSVDEYFDLHKTLEFAPLLPQHAIYLAAMMDGYCDSNWTDWLTEKLTYDMLQEILYLTQAVLEGKDDANEYYVDLQNPNLGVFEKSVFLSDLSSAMDGRSWKLINVYMMELITAFGEYEDVDDMEEGLFEVCDGLVSVYTYDRKQWFNTDPDAQDWVEEAISERGYPEKEFDFDTAYGWGMLMQYENYGGQLLNIFREHTISEDDLTSTAESCLASFGTAFQSRF